MPDPASQAGPNDPTGPAAPAPAPDPAPDPALFAGVSALTFDCYGTLIDWETGILACLRPMLLRAGAADIPDAAILESYARHEARAESGEYIAYREVLARAQRGVLTELAGPDAPATANPAALAVALPTWPAFPDTAESLRTLAKRFEIGVISNIDDDLFDATRRAAALNVAWVHTAQRCGSYKPSPNNFHTALARRGLDPRRVLHIAESLYHDITPCRALGIRCVWVHRRAGKPGSGATHPPTASAQPDLRVTSLAELVKIVAALPAA